MKDSRLYVRLPQELKYELSKAAHREGISDSEAVRRAIKQWIIKNEEE